MGEKGEGEKREGCGNRGVTVGGVGKGEGGWWEEKRDMVRAQRNERNTMEGSGKNGTIERESWFEEREKIKDKRERERAWIHREEEGGGGGRWQRRSAALPTPQTNMFLWRR
ncbi:hypothetical protein Sjap_010740 [Stephania japonica]|uniref:Uncharacterized protein n=1 Tax=Stephania japonica TaxID=461633 RepID=A0AAP0P4F2_9MAGN